MRKNVAYPGIKGLPKRAGAERVIEAIAQHIDTRPLHILPRIVLLLISE